MHNIMTSFIILWVVNYTSYKSLQLFEYLNCIMIFLFQKIKETIIFLQNYYYNYYEKFFIYKILTRHEYRPL